MKNTTKQMAFFPDMPSGPVRRLATGWLILALSSLAGSGLVVILIVLARTPVIYDLIPWVGSFKTALVIHVDLSTLVWFLSFGGLLVTILLPGKLLFGKLSLWFAAAGATILVFSPFLGKDAPFLNNYVPVLDNHAFFLGLSLFASGFGLTALEALRRRLSDDRLSDDPGADGIRALRFGARTALTLALAAATLLAWTYAVMPPELQALESKYHYEILFWSAGHLLQFTHIQFLLLSWLWLTTIVVGGVRLGFKGAIFLFSLGTLPVLVASPLIHLSFEIDSVEFRVAFTTLMIYGGLILLPAGLLVVWSLAKRLGLSASHHSPERTALLLSLFLTAVGGALGFMIQGINVTIPAHYHGSIVAVTLAYMGIIYHLLPRMGFQSVVPHWANRQLILYGLGSFLHISGLAWSGGHGVQRKTAGAAQGLETLADKLPMWVMGLGGILAVVGGILFLVLTFRALAKKNPDQPTTSVP